MKKRKMRRRKHLQRIGAWTVVFAVELLAAALITTIVAAILLTIAQARRGYVAMGGEWLVIFAVFTGSYAVIHRKICNEIFKEGKHE